MHEPVSDPTFVQLRYTLLDVNINEADETVYQ